MHYKVQFDSGLAAWTHSVITFFFLLLQKFITVLCSGEIQPKQSVLFWRTKPDHLQRESLQHFNLLLRSLVFVFTRFGLARFKALQKRSETPTETGSVPVQPVKEAGGCHESTQTKHEWVWPGKTTWFIPGLCQETLQARLSLCLCDTASMPSETESVNTDNHAGADDKSPCCGPLWWVLSFPFFCQAW